MRTPQWYHSFFQGLPVQFWQQFMTPTLAGNQAEAILRLLGLKPGMTVLDVPCGSGWHALAFAEAGLNVTALDISPEFLADGRAADPEARVRWLTADMRDVLLHVAPNSQKAVVSLGNSFGYLTPDDTLRFLKAVRTCLQPGGAFLLNTAALQELFMPVAGHSESYTAGDIRMDISHVLTHRDGCMAVQTAFAFRNLRTGQQQELQALVTHYTLQEVLDLLQLAGFSSCQCYADLDGTPFGADAHQLYLLAR